MPKAYVTYEKWKAKEGHIILNSIKILPPKKNLIINARRFWETILMPFEKEHWILHNRKQWTDYSSA